MELGRTLGDTAERLLGLTLDGGILVETDDDDVATLIDDALGKLASELGTDATDAELLGAIDWLGDDTALIEDDETTREASEGEILDPNPVGEQQASDTARSGNAPNGPT